MEIAEKTKERGSVILAVLSLVVVGFSLLVSTLQTFRHQREAEEQHLFLTTRAVLLSVENSVRRWPAREGDNRLNPQTAEFFQALELDGDVLFAGIVDEGGGKFLTSPMHGAEDASLPPAIVKEMVQHEEWHGRITFEGRGAYIYGKRLKPLRGMHMSLRENMGQPGFLVVGVDMEKSLSAYSGFRKNVIFQAVYILVAVLLTWVLGYNFLSRRDQARKASVLERFQAKLLDNLPDGLITIDTDRRVRAANPAALHILKREAKEVLGKGPDELPLRFPLCFPEDPAQGQSSASWQHINHEGAHLEVLALPLSNDTENSCLLIIRDRTHLHTLEKSLAHAEKLAAVGALAAGVAHEVRNPLSSLRGFAQYFVKKLAGKKPEEEYAKTMVREADRLNRVISDLLFLGRPRTLSPHSFALAPLMRNINTLLRFDLEQKQLSLSLSLSAPFVFADEDALKQALLNLLLNSLDALDAKTAPPQREHKLPLLADIQNGAPPLAKKSAPAQSAEKAAAGETLPATPCLPDLPANEPLRIVSGESADGVWIEVQDAGCGMTKEQQEQAFEAFFTAKKRGTGLGLALVQRIMIDHGGVAAIASEPGKGCTVRLFFPHERELGPAGKRLAGTEGTL